MWCVVWVWCGVVWCGVVWCGVGVVVCGVVYGVYGVYGVVYCVCMACNGVWHVMVYGMAWHDVMYVRTA